MASPTSKALLIVLDGYGLADDPDVSAIDRADKPFIDHLFDTVPHSRLSASGENVGLPAGQFGNSEVGHLNIGAGRIVWQELSRINRSIENGSFFENDELAEAAKKASQRGKVHILGLFSDGGVHSHINHLYALLELMDEHQVDEAYVHAFTDGRDTPPESGIDYFAAFEERAEEIGLGKIASIVGRYYAMDRDHRWERTKRAYDLLVHGEGDSAGSPEEAMKSSYNNNVTDEFVEPRRIADSEESRIQPGDVVIFFNLRGDRARQITRALTEKGFDKFETAGNLDLHYTTFTSYDDLFDWVHVAYPPPEIKNTIGQFISDRHLKQLRIAETEKYAHVTYFLNGGIEPPYPGEDRILIPSPKVATYDLQPEMSAPEVADGLVAQLMTEKYHLCVLNFANPDMVGHTGDMEATVSAIETIDRQLEKVVTSAVEHQYKILIMADHGNADRLIEKDGSPHTAHTDAPVPALIVNAPEVTGMKNGILADVAPTLLKLMGLEPPEEMTGKPLVVEALSR